MRAPVTLFEYSVWQNRSGYGRALREYRHASGLSLRVFARRLGYTAPYILMIENERVPLSRTFYARWAEFASHFQPLPKTENWHRITVTSDLKLPSSFQCNVAPVRCLACGGRFIPRAPNQRVHANVACRRAHRRALVRARAPSL